MQFDYDEFSKKYARVIVKAWNDENYKQSLVANPSQVLKNEGIIVDDYQVKVIDGSGEQSIDYKNKILVLPIPPKPEKIAGLEATDDDFTAFADPCCCCCCALCCCC